MLAFTGTSPLANVLTYLLLTSMGLNESQDLSFFVGVLLLVSSGTFLYVSTIHILPQVFGENLVQSKDDNFHKSKSRIRYTELLVLVSGVFTPMLL